jgi:hypothetical protein
MEINIGDGLNHISQMYEKCFSEKGYQRQDSVKITSMIDDSVTFIGATICVFKPFVLSKTIGSEGRYLLQKSIRTRGVKNLTIPEYCEWGSFFTCLGSIVNYSEMEKLVFDVFDYLTSYLAIDPKDIMIRINTGDKDLMSSLHNINSGIAIEKDSREDVYYKHKYGLDEQNIFGRNFNIAIRDTADNAFKDIGNIIVMESDKEKLAVEVGIGESSILLRQLGMRSSIECSRLAPIYEIHSAEELKLSDCLLVVSNLLYEDVKRIKYPRWPKYYFGRYCKALMYWKNKLGISDAELLTYIREYISSEYNIGYSVDEPKVLNYIRESSKGT